MTGLALLAAQAMATEQHTLCHGDVPACPHTLMADAGALPFVLIVVVLGLQAAGYRRAPLVRVLTGLGTFLASLTIVFVIVGATVFEGDSGDGAAVMALVLTAVALLQVFLEPILVEQPQPLVEQPQPLAEAELPLPRAIVVSR